jgi:hypothetical protein
MSHWEFLELKLGKDIVKYVVQPMLMPSEIQVRRNKIKMLQRLRIYKIYTLGENFRPSVIEECEAETKRELRRISINRHYW